MAWTLPPRRHWLAVCLLALIALPVSLGAPEALADDEANPRVNRIVRLVERARNAVVLIRTPRIQQRVDWFPFRMSPLPEARGASLGSGAIFHTGGYVITNAHVIAPAGKILVDVPRGDGVDTDEYEAVALAVDLPNDLAILRLLPRAGETGRAFPHLPLGHSHDLMLGETCVTLGHPLRLGFTVTRGIISGLDRTLRMKEGYRFDDFIQVDAAVNLGNSGGPLFDVTGRWIGVNTAIFRRGGGSTAEGVGFAIPINRVRALIAKAFKRRMVTGNWLGIDLAEAKDGRPRVHRVYPRGPARESGLRIDDVVLAVNGRAAPTLFDLRMQMARLALGAKISLQVERAGSALAKPVVLQDEPLPTRTLSWKHVGFEVSDTEVNGVLITKVRPDGPAHGVHLVPGDLVEGLGPFRIRNTDDLLRFLQVVEAGDTFKVHIKRISRIAGRQRLEKLRGTMTAE